jgi:hypothetical protein
MDNQTQGALRDEINPELLNMICGPEASVIVMEIQLSRKVQKLIEDRTKEGKCLQCEREAWRRQLCTRCYHRFRAAIQERPKKERPAIEAKMIERGMIAEDRQGQRTDVVNVFRQFAGG